MGIYNQFIDKADYIYLTEIKKEYEGDTFFPIFED
ncbi:dihydrofolate reductase [Patescibacteria group bacterium]|nr:dihydrofolate reductase [Patescibacteria group bacterium]